MKLAELEEKNRELEKKFGSGNTSEEEYKKKKEQLKREISYLEYEADEREGRKGLYAIIVLLIISAGIIFAIYQVVMHREINVFSENFSEISGTNWKIENASYITGGDYDWKLHVTEIRNYKGTVKFNYRVKWSEIAPLTNDILLAFEDYADGDLVTYKHRAWNVPYFGGRSAVIQFTEKGTELYHEGMLKGDAYHVHAIPASQEVYDALQNLRAEDEVEIEGYYSEGITTIYKETDEEYFGNGDCHELLVTKVKRSGYSINIL